MVMLSRIHWHFSNLLFTLEHWLGEPIYRILCRLPSSDYYPPYCYRCHKNWFEIMKDELPW